MTVSLAGFERMSVKIRLVVPELPSTTAASLASRKGGVCAGAIRLRRQGSSRRAIRRISASELTGATLTGLLSPTLSSRGGEGEETACSFVKWLNSVAVVRRTRRFREKLGVGTTIPNTVRIHNGSDRFLQFFFDPIHAMPPIDGDTGTYCKTKNPAHAGFSRN